VSAIDFSPDSKAIALVAYDCTVWIWDLAQVLAKGLRLYADSSKRRRPAHIDSFAGALPRLSHGSHRHGSDGPSYDMQIEHARNPRTATNPPRGHFPDGKTITLGTASEEVDVWTIQGRIRLPLVSWLHFPMRTRTGTGHGGAEGTRSCFTCRLNTGSVGYLYSEAEYGFFCGC
jgi:WD40 repeat protein